LLLSLSFSLELSVLLVGRLVNVCLTTLLVILCCFIARLSNHSSFVTSTLRLILNARKDDLSGGDDSALHRIF
jgi:hypothetical protein